MDSKTPAQDPHVAVISGVMGHHYTWWWRILVRTEFWLFFVPWPLPQFLWLVPSLRRHFRERKSWTVSSGWLTVAIIFWALFVFVVPENAERDIKYAPDAAKVLFQGAFLIGTILSVSVALPGQSVIKAVITDKPEAALNFIVPFMWALMWGIAGGVLFTFYPGIVHISDWIGSGYGLIAVAKLVGIYAGFMEINAIGHTVRLYTIGLLLWGREEAAKKRAQATNEASAVDSLQAVIDAKQALAEAERTQIELAKALAHVTVARGALARAQLETAEREVQSEEEGAAEVRSAESNTPRSE